MHSAALRLGKQTLIIFQVVAFLLTALTITYQAYDPYDDPSGRVLFYTSLGLLAFAGSYLHQFLLFVVFPFSSLGTRVVYTEQRSPCNTWLCTSILSHDNPIFKKKKRSMRCTTDPKHVHSCYARPKNTRFGVGMVLS